MRTSSLLLGLLLAVACAGDGPWLDEVHRPGAPRSTDDRDEELLTLTFVRSVSLPASLPDGAEDALGTERIARAAGFDVFDARLIAGPRHARRPASRCAIT